MSKLTNEDSDRLERRLRERREHLRNHIRDVLLESERHDFVELAGRVRDAGEDSVADLLATTNVSMLNREVSELRDVEDALARISDATYGQCVDCGGDIDRERLEAYPTALRCIECERRREVGRAGGRDQTPSL